MKRTLIILLFLIYFFNSNSESSESSEVRLRLNFKEDFKEYIIKKGDTFSKIAPPSQWEILAKINRIDSKHLIPGKKILIPVNEEIAKNFCPVPKRIDSNYERYERVIIFFLDTQYFGAYEGGKLIFWGPISSGRNNSTPKGKFYVQWKSKNYFSKKYNTAMPYAVNFFKGYFIHTGALPGKPASHGCVRILLKDGRKIYSWLQKGDVIIIK